MPFVVCESVGGPYDDDAFVAGYGCGALDAMLGMGMHAETEAVIRTDTTRQVDLIAMKHECTAVITVTEDPDWSHVEFTKP